MNKNDVKKALECCTDWDTCPDCPYFNNGNRNCSDTMKRHALDLITEQEKEVERLKDIVNRLKQIIHDDVFDQLCPDCAESAVSVFEEIDELIKEVQNAEDKG